MTLTREREDYLKTIYQLQRQASPVRTNTIAKAMGVVPASVTGVITQLAKLNYLKHQPYKGVTLTDNGEREALRIIRRHRLIELYLIKHLNYSWDEVHDEAERLEHAVSPLFVERIATILGHPENDPHGAPIPTREGYVQPRKDTPLTKLDLGQSAIISEVLDDDPALLRYLAEQGYVIGATIIVRQIYSEGKQLLVEVDAKPREELSLSTAANIFVTPID